MNVRTAALWGLLLAGSAAAHLMVSARVGEALAATAAAPRDVEVLVHMPAPPPPSAPAVPRRPLRADPELALEPPDVLVRPAALTPPPPQVPLLLGGAAGGASAVEPLGAATNAAARPGAGIGIGSGIGNALGAEAPYAAYLHALRESGLDVVFVIDATGSMAWALDEVKRRVRDIVDTVRALVPVARFGVVAFRDHDEADAVTRLQPLTYSTAKLDRFIRSLQARGGGSMQEALADGLEVAIGASGWRASAARVVIVIADAPPRATDLERARRQARRFAAAGGRISALDVSHEANPALTEALVGRPVNRALYRSEPMYALRVIAAAGGGRAATMDGDLELTRSLLRLVLGERFAPLLLALLNTE